MVMITKKRFNMNMKNIFLTAAAILCAAVILQGCKESEPVGPKPPKVGDYTITPINGGGIVTYSVPESEDVMYIMAEYNRKGLPYTERSSIYNNTLKIEGFANTDPVEVTLYTMSRKGVKSDPTVMTFTPLTAPIHLVRETLSVATDFAGVSYFWQNRFSTEIGIAFLVLDDMGKFQDHEYRFSKLKDVKETFRGFPSEEQTFGAYLIDNWGNSSDTLKITTIPFFETMTKKPFSRYILPGDTTGETGGWPFTAISNKTWHTAVNTNADAWLSVNGAGKGHMFTIDLTEKFQMSRVVLYPRIRTATEPFGSINVRNIEIWGTASLKTEMLTNNAYYWQDIQAFDEPAEEGGEPIPKAYWKDDWQDLGAYEVVKPDVPEGANSQEIYIAACAAGFSFDMPIDVEPIRYIRFIIRRTWNGVGTQPDVYPTRALNDYFMFSEISMYGDNTVPQN